MNPTGQRELTFVAFGARHHPQTSHALTVYQCAHNRIHGTWTPWP